MITVCGRTASRESQCSAGVSGRQVPDNASRFCFRNHSEISPEVAFFGVFFKGRVATDFPPMSVFSDRRDFGLLFERSNHTKTQKKRAKIRWTTCPDGSPLKPRQAAAVAASNRPSRGRSHFSDTPRQWIDPGFYSVDVRLKGVATPFTDISMHVKKPERIDLAGRNPDW